MIRGGELDLDVLGYPATRSILEKLEETAEIPVVRSYDRQRRVAGVISRIALSVLAGEAFAIFMATANAKTDINSELYGGATAAIAAYVSTKRLVEYISSR